MITKDSLLPEIIREFPGARRVLDEAGLHGCGGALGPRETVEFFARVHGVPLEKLLLDLEAAKDRPSDEYREELGDILYRRFFRAAIVVILTAGATLGASMLLLYGLRHSFTSLDLFPYIQAHANAQIYGWLGLFVMGFAYQGLPRFKYVHLWRPALANLSFIVMVSGIVLRQVSLLPFRGSVACGFASGILEATAIALFAGIIGKTLSAGTVRDAWEKYVLVGAACFLIAGLAEPVIYGLVMLAPSTETLVARVKTWGGPFRDIQILGFAGFMILGVSQRILPTAFGFRAVGRRGSTAAFWMLSLGLLVGVSGWLAFRASGERVWALASWGGNVLYAAGAIILLVGFRALRGGEAGRSTKFIRAAYGWLAVACLMMVAEPWYSRASGLRFSHAYHGAIRHAFTVGFISLMIMGVSSKVVPILQGIDLKALPGLWAPFVLVNAGNALRVTSQVATDHWSAAFAVMGASGMLEVLGLAFWGVHLWRLLGKREEPLPPPRGEIAPDVRVKDAIEAHPELLEVFEEFGFKELRNPILRNTVARRVTVRMACQLKHVDEEKLLSALRARIHRQVLLDHAPSRT